MWKTTAHENECFCCRAVMREERFQHPPHTRNCGMQSEKGKCERWLNHHRLSLARRALHITASQWCPNDDVLIRKVFDQVEILHVVSADLNWFELGDRIVVLTE